MRKNEIDAAKLKNAVKWSTTTEIIAKLVVPITNMILARILAPEVFGVIATVTMVVSFVDMFTDAGFQKYLIQHEFKNDEELADFSNVAFWTNLSVSIALWAIIIVFSDSIAIVVGSPGLGRVISIACIQLLITSFSSIQLAIYRRKLDFKTLFLCRIVGICIPFIVTIPLAFAGLNYWSLIIGTLTGKFIETIILTMKSSWKPKFFYRFKMLKEMFGFSVWSLIESITIWLSAWVDTFLIGSTLNTYYLGVYKTSINTVNSIFSVFTSATTPVVFSTLSRLQNNESLFIKGYFSVQKIAGYILFPMGAGIYLYRELVTEILLGSKWIEATSIIGAWALVSVAKLVMADYCSELYRAKGKPKLSFVVQIIFLLLYVPICMAGTRYGYWGIMYISIFARTIMIVIQNIMIKILFKISPIDTLTNISKPIFCSAIMYTIGSCFKYVSQNIVWSFISILLCIGAYGFVLYIVDRKVFKILSDFVYDIVGKKFKTM